MKRPSEEAVVLFAVLLAAIAAVVMTGAAAGQTAEAPNCSTVNYSGEGTPTDPYEISDVEQLQCIKDQGLGANYRLVSDIDASETSEWNDGAGFEPLGGARDAFTGMFNSADNTVADLTVNLPDEDRVGLFGAVGSNGKVDDVDLDGLDVKGEKEVGGLVGRNSGTVSESSTSGKVNGSESVGGLVGHSGGGNITDSSASAELSGFEGVGGLVGNINEVSGVERSYATGTVEGSFSAGGLVGDNSGNVTASYATGDVNGPSTNAARFTGSERLGGLVGYNSGTVTESYATGSVKGEREVGGLVGQNGGGSIKRSYATGAVRGSDGVGGLIGFNSFGLGTVTHSYWDTETTGQPNSGEYNALRTEDIPDSGGAGATGLTTSEMTGDEAPDNMEGFDFTDTWVTTSGYPEFAWQRETNGGGGSPSDGRNERDNRGASARDRGQGNGDQDGRNHEGTGCSEVEYHGSGNATNPYEVSNADQLQCVGDASTRTEMNDSYVLVSDIEASGTPGWNGGNGFDPIGKLSTEKVVAFDGSFDGTGHSITGITIKRSNEVSVGLFHVIGDTGKVTNVNLTNVDISGSRFTGGLAGGNTDGGEVKGVRVTGKLSGSVHVGGIVGVNGGTVKGLSANVEVNGSDNVGGLVGSNPNGSIVTESHAEGAVDGVESVGGLVGGNGGTVNESYSKGEVEGGDGIGGLVGLNNDNGTVTESYATGAVTGDELRELQVGGLVGRNSGTITESYARGRVEGSDGVGGLVGVNEDGTVDESHAIGAVTGDEQVGGLVGFSDGDRVTDSYWDTKMTGHSSSSGGTGLTAGEMTGHGAPGNMTGFDFEETWQTTDEYPRLAWQVEEDEDSKEDGDASTGSERLPGFTVVTVLLTLLTVAVVLLRRS